MTVEQFPRCETLDDLDDALGRLHGNGLDEEVHMILICSNFYEDDFVELFNLLAYVFQGLLDRLGEHLPTVFRRTDKVVEETRDIVLFTDMLAHEWSLPPPPGDRPQQAAGNTSREFNSRQRRWQKGKLQ